jgi:ubiquinone/menaquinone biosynthesis C-methylase UbiE
LLDVGCGTGVLLHRLSRSHAPSRLSGVDPVPEMLAISRRRLPPEVELREGWAERLPFETDRFDVVVLRRRSRVQSLRMVFAMVQPRPRQDLS